MTETNILKQLWELQDQNDDFWIDRLQFQSDPEYRNIIITQRIADLHEEITELKNTFHLSEHKLHQYNEDRYNSLVQIIDATKYLMGLASLLKFKPDEFVQAFIDKSRSLQNRWEQRQVDMSHNTQVICIDIDGVLADFETGYVNWIENTKGLKPVDQDARTMYSFHSRYGITKAKDEELISEWIKGRGFYSLSPYPDAQVAVNELKQAGYKIVLITARPAKQHNVIYPDTELWLHKNGIEYDLLLWDKDKSNAVTNHVYPASVVAFIEDRDKHAIELAHIGIKVLLIDRSYNQNFDTSKFDTIQRVSGWPEIKAIIMEK
jgi:uncharacterized HAD superfamily protein